MVLACTPPAITPTFFGGPPLSHIRFHYGIATVVVLVALRLGIGWHFYSEGADKLRNGFSSAGFLRAAKGPFARSYQNFLPDEDGRERLNYDPEHAKFSNPTKTTEKWEHYRERLASHFGFDDEQRKEAEEVVAKYKKELESFTKANADDIANYFRGLDRRDVYRAEPGRVDVPSLRGQIEKIEGDLKKTRGPWLAAIDSMWNGLETELNELVNEDQARRGLFALPRPGAKSLDVRFVDWFIPRFDFTIGLLLLIGLFTRPAAVLGAAFLGSVMLAQWPWAYGSIPIYNQGVEALALLVLAATGAGRFAGVDLLLRAWWFRVRAPKQPPKKG